MDSQGPRDRRDPTACRVCRAIKAQVVIEVRKEIRVRRDIPDTQEPREIQEIQDKRETRGL